MSLQYMTAKALFNHWWKNVSTDQDCGNDFAKWAISIMGKEIFYNSVYNHIFYSNSFYNNDCCSVCHIHKDWWDDTFQYGYKSGNRNYDSLCHPKCLETIKNV